ncbi:PqqD family protein [bacterium]|nr:PqqD family protein [bacterium]
MNFFQRRAKLKNINYLEVTPIRVLHEEVDENNLVTVLIPKVTNRLAKKYFEPMLKSPLIKLKLDEIGSASWLAIDGKKNVAEIASELVQKFGDKINPVEERLTKYLTTLYEQRFITFQEIKGEK